MRYLIGTVVGFIGGSFSMMALIGSVLKSFEPHHPALILVTLMLMGFTALGYIMCGSNFRKWRQSRESIQYDTGKLIDGAKNGWSDPERVRGIATHPKGGRINLMYSVDEERDF